MDTNLRPLLKQLNTHAHRQEYAKASQLLLKNYTLIQQQENLPYYNYFLSTCYIGARNLRSAKELLQKETNEILIPYNLEKFGVIYTEKGELAIANKYFKLQLKNAQSDLMKGRALRNVAITFRKQYQLDSAVKYFKTSNHYFSPLNHKFKLINDIDLAEIDKTKGYYLKAKKELKKILYECLENEYSQIAGVVLVLLMETHEDLYEFNSISNYFKDYNGLYLLEETDEKLAFLRYQIVYSPENQIEKKEKFIHYKNLLQILKTNKSNSFTQLIESLKTHDSILIANQNTSPLSKLNKQQNSQGLLKWWIIGLSIIFCIGFLSIYFYNRNNISRRIKNLQKERKELHKRIERQNRELTDLAINLKRKRQFDEEFLKKVEFVKNSSFSHKEQITKLSNELKNQVGQGYTNELLQENINELNSKFNAVLSEKHPNLTNYDKELCGLIRLNFSNKEIANLKNISSQSARTAKYRLKQKLELDAEIDLIEYLQKL
ncbi:hypothetical protein [Lishizhenia sp.]|uniref:hypothetical protein n=1 Tax=Lishizhenia sp. TaxID=2497594 RepID=UPI00299E42EB|nr:hypothetical protein [Lishizhenia sp.]MDX1445476.1 hypothetical protein [Lishizhenia sp.]